MSVEENCRVIQVSAPELRASNVNGAVLAVSEENASLDRSEIEDCILAFVNVDLR